jgi:glutamine cyclotransferase
MPTFDKKYSRLVCLILLMFSLSVAIISCPSSRTSDRSVYYTCKIVATYPHDSQAFTQGLIFEDGVLYESTGLYEKSTLRKVELSAGRILQMHKLADEFFAEGIAICGNRIVQLTYKSGVGFVYNRDTFEVLNTFNYPGEGWGLTYDGEHLVLSDGTATLRLLDPETYEQVSSIEVRDGTRLIEGLNELEYVKGHIYANLWPTERIVIVDPKTGQVSGWVNLQEILKLVSNSQAEVPNGIAYDAAGDRLFVTGKYWPELFEMRLVAEK